MNQENKKRPQLVFDLFYLMSFLALFTFFFGSCLRTHKKPVSRPETPFAYCTGIKLEAKHCEPVEIPLASITDCWPTRKQEKPPKTYSSLNKNQVIYELSNDLLIRGSNNRAIICFNLNRQPGTMRTRPIGATRQKTVVHSVKKFEVPPSIEVRSFEQNAANVRDFFKYISSQEEMENNHIMFANRAQGGYFKGLKILSMNGIEDSNNVLDKNNALLEQSTQFYPLNEALSKPEQNFVVKHELLNYITNRVLMFNSMAVGLPDGAVSNITTLNHSSIDTGNDRWNALFDIEHAGFVTHINHETKELEVFGSVLRYAAGLDDLKKLRGRVKLLLQEFPVLRNVITGVSYTELDHFDGTNTSNVVGLDYDYGPTVALPKRLHAIFTYYRTRDDFQVENFFSNQHFLTMEDRNFAKNVINQRILDIIPDKEFQNICLTKQCLRSSFNLVSRLSTIDTQFVYTSKNITSSDFLTSNGARAAIDQILPSIGNLKKSLLKVRLFPEKELDVEKLTTSSSLLFRQIYYRSVYVRNVIHHLGENQAANSWINEMAIPCESSIRGVLSEMKALGFNLGNASQYFPQNFKGYILPNTNIEQYMKDLTAPLTNILTPAELADLATELEIDKLEGQYSIFFNVRKNLFRFK